MAKNSKDKIIENCVIAYNDARAKSLDIWDADKYKEHPRIDGLFKQIEALEALIWSLYNDVKE